MAKLLCLLALCLTAVGGLPRKEKIINGSLTTIDQYPFMAVILLARDGINFIHQCGGTIINNRSVLSAAHCFIVPASATRIRVGSTFGNSGGNVHITSRLLIHPDYVIHENHLDIGIIRVTTAFSFGNNIQVGRIAGPLYNIGVNQAVSAAGWGYTSTDLSPPSPSEHLRHIQIRTVSQTACERLYGPSFKPYMVCAGGGGVGVCFGDSGGPLIHNNVVIGVLALTLVPCGREPAAFVQVSTVANWIQVNA